MLKNKTNIKRNVSGVALGIAFALTLVLLLGFVHSLVSWTDYNDTNTYYIINVDRFYDTVETVENDETTSGKIYYSSNFYCEEYAYEDGLLILVEVEYEPTIFGTNKEFYTTTTYEIDEATDDVKFEVLTKCTSNVSYRQYVKYLWLRDANACPVGMNYCD